MHFHYTNSVWNGVQVALYKGTEGSVPCDKAPRACGGPAASIYGLC